MLNGGRASPFARSVCNGGHGLRQPGTGQSQECWAVEVSLALQVFKKGEGVAPGDMVTMTKWRRPMCPG